MKGFRLLLVLVLTSAFVHGQNKVFEPQGSISVDLGIPAQGKNESFRNVMNGLFNGGINYQHNVFKGLTIGVGAKYSFFIVNSFALGNVEWRGGLHTPAVYGKIGYEKFITDRFSLNFGVKSGYAMQFSTGDSCKVKLGGPYQENAFFLEPQLELLLLTDKNSSDGFSFVLGYNMIFSEFGPQFLCMETLPNSVPEHYEGITRYLTIGFGYRYYLGRN